MNHEYIPLTFSDMTTPTPGTYGSLSFPLPLLKSGTKDSKASGDEKDGSSVAKKESIVKPKMNYSSSFCSDDSSFSV